MTEKEAWLHIADLYRKAEVGFRGHYEVLVNGEPSVGICSAILSLTEAGHLNFLTLDRMRERIKLAMPVDASYLFPLQSDEGRNQRVQFCEEQAELCN